MCTEQPLLWHSENKYIKSPKLKGYSMYIDSIVRIKVIRASFMDKSGPFSTSFRNNSTYKQDWQYICITIDCDDKPA